MSPVVLGRAAARGAVLAGLCLLPGGCKRSESRAPAPSAAPSSSSAPVPEQASEPSRCTRLAAYSLTLESEPTPTPKGQTAPDSEDADDEALLPFGVDVGTAVPTTYGFAVAGLRGAGQAFVAVLGERASRRVDLGELHGDAETPALAGQGERAVVALRSSDAAGFTIKLGQLVGLEGGVEWGAELSKLGKDVTALSLALSAERGLLGYLATEKGTSRLWLASFAPASLKAALEPKAFELKDVESPRILARPGGFWLSWVRTLPEAKKPPPKPAPDAGDPEERDLLDVGLRVLEVAKLDERGSPQGSPLRIGEPRRQVLLYDVAQAASGSLLVALRSDSAAPGAEGGALLLVEVGADGSVHEERLEDDEIGAGAPILLVDGNAALHEPWLSVSSPNDATRLGKAHGQRTVLSADPLLARAEVVALSAGHFLTQRSRGRAAQLSTLDCRLDEAPAPAAPEKK